MEKLVQAFGARRIAWGSNFPASEGTLGALLDEARAATAELNAAQRESIFRGTALALYPALAD